MILGKQTLDNKVSRQFDKSRKTYSYFWKGRLWASFMTLLARNVTANPQSNKINQLCGYDDEVTENKPCRSSEVQTNIKTVSGAPVVERF